MAKVMIYDKWCGPISTRVMDVLHGLALLAVLGSALYNLTLTIQQRATVRAMLPVFITTLISAILKIPSQICAARGRVGGYLSLAGSVVTVVITAILVGYIAFDPLYANDRYEDVCAVVREADNSIGKYAASIENILLAKPASDKTVCDDVCPKSFTSNTHTETSNKTPSTEALRRFRTPHAPALWSPVFHN